METEDCRFDVSLVQICEPISNKTIVTRNQRNPLPPLFNSTPLVPMVKEVRRGFRAGVTPKSCGLIFEQCPVWLWTIRPSEWHTIVMTRADEKRLEDNYPSTWERFKTRIKAVLSVEAGLNISEAWEAADLDVWWISGSGAFCESVRLSNSDRRVIWRSDAGRRTPKSEGGWRWYRVSHQNVGGVTNARGSFGVAGFDMLSLCHDLPRTLAHVLKHSLRATPCEPKMSEDHYTVHDRLCLGRAELPILYETHFSRTGWGRRMLDECELALAFELPDFVRWDKRFLTEIVPLQMMRAVMDEIVAQLTPAERPEKRIKVSHSPLESSPVTDADRHWLPTLEKWLPGSWADLPISDRAVKSDDATINFLPWHSRIQMVLPWCRYRLITFFEQLGLRRWKRNITRSLRTYMSETYGAQWLTKLIKVRQGARSGKRDLELTSAVIVKRRKTLWDSVNRGVVTEVLPSVLGAEEKDVVDSELLIDGTKACAVLAQILECSWWEWSRGSALCFWRWNGPEQVRAARDGMEVFVASPLPRGRGSKSKMHLSSEERKMVSAKLDTMFLRFYLEEGYVENKVHFFGVPKGDDDIRVVFDGTSSGLNECLWAPNFYLPTSRAAATILTFTTWMADADFGEMFHNFPMPERIRKSSGVEISQLVPYMAAPVSVGKHGQCLLRWSRLFMGMRPSPYNAVRFYYCRCGEKNLSEVILGLWETQLATIASF